MSKDLRGWSLQGIVLVTVLLAAGGQKGYSQAPLTVTASASNATPNPALVNETVSASLSASVANPPSSTYTCPLSGPLWTWSFGAVQLNGAPTQAAYQLTINQPSSSSANATLTGSFSAAGSWTVTLNVQVTYTDSPCNDTWTASPSVTVSVTVVNVQLSPNPLCVPLGGMATVTVTTTPSGYASNVTVSSGDPSIASVSGSSPNFTVAGLAVGSTNLLCYYGGRPCQVVCPVYVFTANLTMTGVAAGQKLTPGGYVPLNANNDNGSVVTNGLPATRDKDTSPIPNEKDLVQITLGVTGSPGN